MPLKFTKEIFLEKANLKHKQKYNYNNFVYINSKIKGLISCEENGDFYQSPNDHLQGHGCPRCAGLNKKTTQEIIEKLQQKFMAINMIIQNLNIVE